MGKKTISFVATEELAEWIEEEADRRMTTISSAAQQLLAEKYREEQEGGLEQKVTDETGVLGVFERCPDEWWRPDSEKYEFAVRQPDGDARYYKTAGGAAEALKRWHEE